MNASICLYSTLSFSVQFSACYFNYHFPDQTGELFFVVVVGFILFWLLNTHYIEEKVGAQRG